ncbi:sugar O-acetyltransferase [Chitiniphilus shinanonensis]|uniref:sugar O-acetyltransferase n=1 Tax=Chitiniphilus shinanonensis TaxID=553088 RepID=UPI00305895C0
MRENLVTYGFDEIFDPEARERYEHERAMLLRYNDPSMSWEEHHAMLPQLVAECGEGTNAAAPLYIGRGSNIRLGRKVFINSGSALDGGAPITIGDYTLIAPGVQVLTVTHPVDPMARQRCAFQAAPITIGQNVWIGAGVIICAGVTIGDHSVIGAGSIVTRDVPSCVLAAGNPCRVVRQLDPPDMATLYAEREKR